MNGQNLLAPRETEAKTVASEQLPGDDAISMSTQDHMNGWLDPSGRFYPLDLPSQHCQWCIEKKVAECNRTLSNPGCILDELGWFKLSKGAWIIFLPYKATQHQIDYVWDWYLANQREPDDLVKLLREFNQ
jgi:hypothetical protein